MPPTIESGSVPQDPRGQEPPSPQVVLPVTVIRRSRGFVPLDLRELWAYRELLFFLTWRDIKVRYRQTVLGALWAIIQPVFTMVVFTIFFGELAKVPSDGAPYPLFALAGLLPWTFFAYALSQAGSSLVGSQHLISKVYFPRRVIPISATLSGLVDLAIAFLVLMAMMAWYGYVPTLGVLFLPLFVLLALVAALAVGLWLAALNVQYRDIRYTIPFLTQLWLFATPIAYPVSLVPETYWTLYALNPMVGVVEGFRWALLGTGQPPGMITLVSGLVVLALLVGGTYYFRRMERTFADVI
jgi:lipopolysaccharide transport system permease protein